MGEIMDAAATGSRAFLLFLFTPLIPHAQFPQTAADKGRQVPAEWDTTQHYCQT